MELAGDARVFTGGRGEAQRFLPQSARARVGFELCAKGSNGAPDHQGCDETEEAGSLSLKECSHHEVDLADSSHSTASATGSGEIRQGARAR